MQSLFVKITDIIIIRGIGVIRTAKNFFLVTTMLLLDIKLMETQVIQDIILQIYGYMATIKIFGGNKLTMETKL